MSDKLILLDRREKTSVEFDGVEFVSEFSEEVAGVLCDGNVERIRSEFPKSKIIHLGAFSGESINTNDVVELDIVEDECSALILSEALKGFDSDHGKYYSCSIINSVEMGYHFDKISFKSQHIPGLSLYLRYFLINFVYEISPSLGEISCIEIAFSGGEDSVELQILVDELKILPAGLNQMVKKHCEYCHIVKDESGESAVFHLKWSQGFLENKRNKAFSFSKENPVAEDLLFRDDEEKKESYPA